MSDGGKGSSPRPFSVDQQTFANNWDQIFDKKKQPAQTEPVRCYCYKCNENYIPAGETLPVTMSRMIVCPTCGNKRCPHSTDHNLACTDSNEPSQVGSRYQ